MPTDSLITQSIPSLINGVSQQPSNQRLTSQAEAQDNVVSAVAEGAVVRPPAEHIAILGGPVAGAVPTGGYKIGGIDRGDGERFTVILEDGDVNVYNTITGAEVTVNDNAAGTPGSYTYLDFNTGTHTAEQAFELVTVADYTFIVNKTIATAMSGVPSAGRTQDHEFLIALKPSSGAAVSDHINVTLGAQTVTTTGTTTVASVNRMNALCLACSGVNNPSATAGVAGTDFPDWRFTRIADNLLHAYQATGTLDEVTTEDNYGNTVHTLLATNVDGTAASIASFSDLPTVGLDGFTAKIKGSEGNEEDDFYVTYSEEDNVWKESKEVALDDSFDADTMPHALVYTSGTGQFSFEPIAWDDRLVGDTLSAPEPSFIGKTVNDIVLHKDRLVLVSDENAIASEAGELFNFWPTTVTTLVDSDTWDISGTGNTVAIWDYAIPYNGNLTLFSATGNTVAEVVGSRDEPLTVKNARIEERGNYAISSVRPVASGNQVYFLLDRGGSTSVHGYLKADVDLFRADEITSHVQKYLPTGMYKMSASPAESMITFLSNDTAEDHRVYVYRYHFLGTEQVMSSWSRWAFADDDVILSAEWIESVLYLLISRQDGVHLEKVDFGKVDEDEGAFGANDLGYRVGLDSLVSLTGVYSVPADTTTWVMPYDQATNGGTYRIIKGGAWGTDRGSNVPVSIGNVDLFMFASGDHSAQPVYIGREYQWSYELSEPHVRTSSTTTRATSGYVGGRYQLRRGRVTYKDTGTFDVEIRSKDDSDVYTQTFTSQFLNQAVFGPTSLDTGVFEFGIGGDSRNVRIIFTSNSFLPAQLSAIEYDGRYYEATDRV